MSRTASATTISARHRKRKPMDCLKLAVAMMAVVLTAGAATTSKPQGNALQPEQAKQMMESRSSAFMGYRCLYTQWTVISWGRRFYVGNFRCPSWTRIMGYYGTPIRAIVFIRTFQDFVRKIYAAGLISRGKAGEFLPGFNQDSVVAG